VRRAQLASASDTRAGHPGWAPGPALGLSDTRAALTRPGHTARASARVSLDPDVLPAPLSVEFYFDLRTYEVKQCVFEGNLICL